MKNGKFFFLLLFLAAGYFLASEYHHRDGTLFQGSFKDIAISP